MDLQQLEQLADSLFEEETAAAIKKSLLAKSARVDYDTKFRLAMRRFKRLQKQNVLLRAAVKDAPTMTRCNCGRPKQMSHSRCFACQDAVTIMRAKYRKHTVDEGNAVSRDQSPPRILERAIHAPVRSDPLAKRGKADELQNLSFDDIVKLYEDCQ
jgi:hypothetical protein